MAIDVIKPGFFTTIQDEGRIGFQQFGMPVSGAMDAVAYRIANMLVRQQQAAVLEMTLVGPTLQFTKPTTIAITGGDFVPQLNGKSCPMWRPVPIHAGDVLTCGYVQQGARGYIAIAGGIDVRAQFQSRSTYTVAQIGGFAGRALVQGDVLPYKASTPMASVRWQVAPREQSAVIRIVEGMQTSLLTADSKRRFAEQQWTVSQQSNRIGYRLEGEPLACREQVSLLSEAVTFGTVQLPANGLPIVLMADRQTIGGYPKIAQVAAVDLPQLAQLKPGDSFQFQWIEPQQAQQLWLAQERSLRLLETILSQTTTFATK